MEKETVKELGIWSIRFCLASGAVYCAITGDNETAGTLGGILIVSFFLL